jgi:hypothetical protein
MRGELPTACDRFRRVKRPILNGRRLWTTRHACGITDHSKREDLKLS